MKLALRWLGHPEWDATVLNQNTVTNAKKTLLSWLENASQSFMQRLITDAEPRVWHTCDAEGKLWWHAHDSVTGRSLYNASEAEIRIWLEQRHNLALMD
ncbi:MAG: hypothetical protein KME42_04470 [Tildeniella nuda ZEHNDER 1965/U140]|jgi:hypothetical protein|nr:hypothetical protein [Tildeniella nuda ZEHNDER 1965/U140]